MTNWREVSVGAGQIDGGLQKIGAQGPVHIAFEDPSDGERLEAAYHKHTKFSDLVLPNGTMMRTCKLNGVTFRWLKR